MRALPSPSLRPPFVPLRVRLAALYGLVLGATLLLFAGFVQAALARELADEVDRSLQDRAHQVVDTVQVEVLFPRRGRVVLPDPDVFATGGAFIQVVDMDGQVVAASANLGNQTLPVERDTLAAARGGRSLFQTVRPGPESLRVYEAPLRVNNTTVGVLQVARSLAPIEQAARRLRALLLTGGLISLAVSLLVSAALAGAALAPINRITEAARRIGAAHDFSQTVHYEGPPDEVGRLAATFNAMLSELRQAFDELRRANDRLESTLSGQRRFVADASHELRTPLTTIRGNAGLLRTVPNMPDEDRAEALQQIVGESERMSRLVADLLTLARADAGQHITRQPVALRPLVEEVSRQARVLSESVRVTTGSLDDASVLGHTDYLKQLLLILVDNGIKYTPAGGHVLLSLTREGDLARLEVADDGVGIAPADLPHIFDRFYRADRARQSGGTGLGLAIARWIVEEHDGSIDVASEPGRGTIFRIWLPATQDLVPAASVDGSGIATGNLTRS